MSCCRRSCSFLLACCSCRVTAACAKQPRGVHAPHKTRCSSSSSSSNSNSNSNNNTHPIHKPFWLLQPLLCPTLLLLLLLQHLLLLLLQHLLLLLQQQLQLPK